MKKIPDSRFIDAQLERGLQEVFRRKGWIDSRQEFEDTLNSRSECRSEVVDEALRKFDEHFRTTARARRYWTHPSVLALAEDDPIGAITQRAREKVLQAMEEGWSGPPYDPFALAEHLKIRVIPTEMVIDARTRGTGATFTIEFNPNRPPARIRYSIAHEVAHTLFPDCAAAIRNRATHEDMTADEWQLEMLCNIAASEILMPLGTLKEAREIPPSIDNVRELRRTFHVSFEAMALRLVRITDFPCFAFATRHDSESDRYKLDYRICSAAWRSATHLEPGFTLPKQSGAAECTAISSTAKYEEQWVSSAEPWSVEYLGIPPYPGQVRPRVIGIASPLETMPRQTPHIKYVKGDATEPRGSGQRMILQVVNDKALIWGAGFSRQIRKKWPHAQTQFKEWVLTSRRQFKLGSVHFAKVDEATMVASLVAQWGYGPAKHPRIRYNALSDSLKTVAELADAIDASIQMPKIGSGLAGGAWEVVEDIVEEALCRRGLRVTVCELIDESHSTQIQGSLQFGRRKRDES